MKKDNPKENNVKKEEQVGLSSFYTISVIGQGSYAKVLLVKKKDTG